MANKKAIAVTNKYRGVQMNFRNKLLNIDVREGIDKVPDESIDCIITSPPYWSQRDYQVPHSIWDGDPNYEHKFEEIIENQEGYTSSKRWQHGESRESNPKGWSTEIKKYGFCLKCGAWSGALGLEPDFKLWIKHLCDIYDKVWRILKKTGTNWVNLGDVYSAGGRSGSKEYFEKGHKQFGKEDPQGRYQAPNKVKGFKQKCLLMLPERFAIEMVKRGWILRNVCIWHKSNPIPSSAKDRFTVDFEYIYLFVKSSKAQYYVNENTLQLVQKLPKERIENIDWEWRECPICKGKGHITKKRIIKINDYAAETMGSPRGSYKEGPCKKCKGSGRIKYNFWRGHHYFFDQDVVRENISESKSNTERRKYTPGKSNAKITHTKDNKVAPNAHFQQYWSKGRNKRCVWTIPTCPNPAAHFATFPPELVKPMILSGCPKKVCSECGMPREKILKNTKEYEELKDKWKHINMGGNIKEGRNRETGYPGHITKEQYLSGYTNCGCNPDLKPGIVLDIFAGTGTTLLQAWKLGRDYLGFEISKEYCEDIAKMLLDPTKNRRMDMYLTKKIVKSAFHDQK